MFYRPLPLKTDKDSLEYGSVSKDLNHFVKKNTRAMPARVIVGGNRITVRLYIPLMYQLKTRLYMNQAVITHGAHHMIWNKYDAIHL